MIINYMAILLLQYFGPSLVIFPCIYYHTLKLYAMHRLFIRHQRLDNSLITMLNSPADIQ